MKSISIIFFLVVLSAFQAHGQSQNSTPASNPVQPENQVTEIAADSTQKAPQAVIQSNVNKDGVIEISRKEFDKIPPARQELMKNNKNYKIVEDK
jgi:hypothetical protein